MSEQISVIIPVYNVEAYLSKCLDSVLNQEYTNLEIILVNDGSVDNSGEICNDYAKRDSRIRVIHQKNCGVSVARNVGIERSTGKYITFVDSDDYIDSDYLRILYDCHCDLPICGFETVDQEGIRLHSLNLTPVRYIQKNQIDYVELYKKMMLYSPCCKLFRADIIREKGLKFPLDITWGEDGMFVADYLPYVSSMEILPYSGYYYVKYNSKNSLSTRIRTEIMDMITVSREYCIEKTREYAPNAYEGVKRICKEDILYNCVYFIKRLFDSKIDRREKETVLSIYLRNKYVQNVFLESQKYFDGHNYVRGSAVGPNDASWILNKHMVLHKKDKLVQMVLPLYNCIPEVIKDCYRKIKQRVRK